MKGVSILAALRLGRRLVLVLAALLANSPLPGVRATSPGAQAVAPVQRLELRRTARHLDGSGDPIWELRLQLPRGRARAFEALVGRADRQRADRHRLGSQAPLPPGRYRLGAVSPLDRSAEPDLPSELGNLLWIGLEPQFRTDRRGLGIHHDPSAGRGSESGTDGCIGVIKAHDLVALGSLLQHHRPTELVVLN